MLSFFVPLGWFTAVVCKRLGILQLWIAFVLCTFGLIYSLRVLLLCLKIVVNCFRSLYLWVDLQQAWSFCWWAYLLWIAFVLCTFGLIYSISIKRVSCSTVVNCFRSLYLWVDLQPISYSKRSSRVVNCFRSLYLWVDLQHEVHQTANVNVVNCFRSLYLWVDLQPNAAPVASVLGCELLSFFVPLGWFTAYPQMEFLSPELWIAFVLCTFGLIYSHRRDGRRLWLVVNCFRSLYLWVDLQQGAITINGVEGCELLSFFVPLGWFTAPFGRRVRRTRCELLSFFVPLGWFTAIQCLIWLRSVLWIAFVLCTFGLIYSINQKAPSDISVVNCFRSLYLWVDLQPLPLSTLVTVVVNCFRSLYLWVDLQLFNGLPIIFYVVNCFRSLYLWVDLQRLLF